MTIRSSDRAILLDVTEEDGDQNYYLKCESHFSWPGGSSGPTVAIGYDCGYSTSAKIAEDWTGFVDQERIAVLMRAAGYTGTRGRDYVAAHHNDITITWD